MGEKYTEKGVQPKENIRQWAYTLKLLNNQRREHIVKILKADGTGTETTDNWEHLASHGVEDILGETQRET